LKRLQKRVAPPKGEEVLGLELETLAELGCDCLAILVGRALGLPLCAADWPKVEDQAIPVIILQVI